MEGTRGKSRTRNLLIRSYRLYSISSVRIRLQHVTRRPRGSAPPTAKAITRRYRSPLPTIESRAPSAVRKRLLDDFRLHLGAIRVCRYIPLIAEVVLTELDLTTTGIYWLLREAALVKDAAVVLTSWRLRPKPANNHDCSADAHLDFGSVTHSHAYPQIAAAFVAY